VTDNAPEKTHPLTPDGGRAALRGFEYQILASLGLESVRTAKPNQGINAELSSLLDKIPDSELWHEYLGQDIVIVPRHIEKADECELIQCKVSWQNPVPNIDVSELRGILKSFDLSRQEAEDTHKYITRYTVLTNRGKAKNLEQSRLDLDQNPQTPPGYKLILQKLHFITQVSIDIWYEHLTAFGRLFGANRSEIATGIDQLIGLLLHRTVHQSSFLLKEEDLIEAFTKYSSALALIPANILTSNKSSLDDFSKINIHLHNSYPVRRSLLDDISRASQERSLIILTGAGGCGKSVALWQWISDQVKNGKIGMILPAEDVQEHCIAQLISDWRGFPHDAAFAQGLRAERAETALERLVAAQPSARLTLGIDGLDEDAGDDSRNRRMKNTINWFLEKDQNSSAGKSSLSAICVVTCRKYADISDLLTLSNGYSERAIVHRILVEDFSDDELKEAAKHLFDTPTYDRFAKSLSPEDPFKLESFMNQVSPTNQNRNSSLQVLGGSPINFPPINDALLIAIHHPAMWQAFLNLPAPDQLAALNGEPTAMKDLARIFLGWFVHKVVKRNKVVGCDKEGICLILAEIARQYSNKTSNTKDDWFKSAKASNISNDLISGRLYDEALTGGIIDQDDRRLWFWRHRFVTNYLLECY